MAGVAGAAGHPRPFGVGSQVTGRSSWNFLMPCGEVARAGRVDGDGREGSRVGDGRGGGAGAGTDRVGDRHRGGAGVAGADAVDDQADELDGAGRHGRGVPGDGVHQGAVVDGDSGGLGVARARVVHHHRGDRAVGIHAIHGVAVDDHRDVTRRLGSLRVGGEVEVDRGHGVAAAAVGDDDLVDPTRGAGGRSGAAAAGEVDGELGVVIPAAVTASDTSAPVVVMVGVAVAPDPPPTPVMEIVVVCE